MAQAARARELLAKFAFTVKDPATGTGGAKFQKCTGAEMSVAIGEYSEGGAMAPMKEGTRVSFSNVTLERGVSTNTYFYAWCLEMANFMKEIPTGKGTASPDQLRNINIYQRARDRSVIKTMHLYNAQPARFSPGEWDNTSDDIQIEELELAYEYFDVTL